MNSQVFYRRWRPQTLAEVVGQEHVTVTLRNAVASGHISHAYLFSGSRGTGKTSTGRVLAKAVNCLNPIKGEPCTVCEVCLAISEGRALDVVEIDAASNRGIDEIRNLKEKVNYAPNLARYKVYIIDEVHMLTEPASNALLKTLEEPPSHVIFVLATTEPHKVLSTILSRCQRFDFRRLSQEVIVSKLQRICEKEGIGIPIEGLKLIARATSGSLRDAENLLEQLVTYYGFQVTLNQVQTFLGVTGDRRVRELVEHILNKRVSASLATINSVVSDGLNLSQFNRELVEFLRNLLLVKSGSEDLVDVTKDELAEMRSLVADVPLEYLLKVLKIFGAIDLRAENYSALPLELAVVECALSLTEGGAITSPVVSSIPREPQSLGKPAPEPGGDFIKEPSDGLKYLRSRWKEFIDALRGEGSSGNLDALLRSACEPVAVEGETVVLGFYYRFHKEKIEDPKYSHLVERKLKEIFGIPYQLRCILIPRDNKVRSPQEKYSPLVRAVLGMGAKIVDTSSRDGESKSKDENLLTEVENEF